MFLESEWSHFGGQKADERKDIWIFFCDFGFFGRVFEIRIVTFWRVRKLKKTDQRDISLILEFGVVFLDFGGLYWILDFLERFLESE